MYGQRQGGSKKFYDLLSGGGGGGEDTIFSFFGRTFLFNALFLRFFCKVLLYVLTVVGAQQQHKGMFF